MSQIALVNPQIHINNITIPYVPNSLKIDLGFGEQDVKATAGGGGSSETVFFDNAESNVGMVTFEMFSTDVAIISHIDWKTLGSFNTVQISGEANINIYFHNMAQTSKVEIEVGDAKMMSFEFKGNQAIVG